MSTKRLPAHQRKLLVRQAIVIHDLHKPHAIQKYVNLMKGPGYTAVKHATVKLDVDEVRQDATDKFTDMAKHGTTLKIGIMLTRIYKEIVDMEGLIDALYIPKDWKPDTKAWQIIQQAQKTEGFEQAAQDIYECMKFRHIANVAGKIAFLNEQVDKKRQFYTNMLATYPLMTALKGIKESQEGSQNGVRLDTN